MSNNIIDKIQLSGVTYDIGGQGGSGVSVVEVTQVEYDALPTSAKTDTSKMYVITDAEAGDLTNYYTKSEVDNAITAATSTKQDTLVSSVNIKTINNESLLGSGNIDIQGGGGKAIEAGRGISVTTGETADTVSFNLPISGGSGTNSIIIGAGETGYLAGSLVHGIGSTSSGIYSNVFGYNCFSNGHYSFLAGGYLKNYTECGAAFGKYNDTTNSPLFSVGNGTADNARHNAFEIRQNGDIYITSGNTDIKLQDHLGGGGGSITIDPSLDSGSTNAVANSAITTALDNKANLSDVVLYNYGNSSTYSTAFVSSKTAYRIVVNLTNNVSWYFRVFDGSRFVTYGVKNNGNFLDSSGNQIDAPYFINTDLTNYSSGTFDICFNTDNVYADYFANTTEFTFTIYESISIKPLKTQVIENTTALGGLSLVKLTQSAYDALSPNYDSNTLYVIVN